MEEGGEDHLPICIPADAVVIPPYPSNDPCPSHREVREYPATLGPVRWLVANAKECHVVYMALAAEVRGYMRHITHRVCCVDQCVG